MAKRQTFGRAAWYFTCVFFKSSVCEGRRTKSIWLSNNGLFLLLACVASSHRSVPFRRQRTPRVVPEHYEGRVYVPFVVCEIYVCARRIYTANNLLKILQKLFVELRLLLLMINVDRFSPEVKSLMHKLLARDPKKRITTKTIQETAWYNNARNSKADVKYVPFQAKKERLDSAESETKVHVEMTESETKVQVERTDQPVAAAVAPRAPTYVWHQWIGSLIHSLTPPPTLPPLTHSPPCINPPYPITHSLLVTPISNLTGKKRACSSFFSFHFKLCTTGWMRSTWWPWSEVWPWIICSITTKDTILHGSTSLPRGVLSHPIMFPFWWIGRSKANVYHILIPLDRRCYDFESALPVEEIVPGMKLIMQKTGMATLQSEKATTMTFSVQRKRRKTVLIIDIFAVVNKLNIVKIRRGDGDAVAYHKFMARIGPEISKEIGISNQGPSGIVVCAWVSNRWFVLCISNLWRWCVGLRRRFKSNE